MPDVFLRFLPPCPSSTGRASESALVAELSQVALRIVECPIWPGTPADAILRPPSRSTSVSWCATRLKLRIPRGKNGPNLEGRAHALRTQARAPVTPPPRRQPPNAERGEDARPAGIRDRPRPVDRRWTGGSHRRHQRPRQGRREGHHSSEQRRAPKEPPDDQGQRGAPARWRRGRCTRRRQEAHHRQQDGPAQEGRCRQGVQGCRQARQRTDRERRQARRRSPSPVPAASRPPHVVAPRAPTSPRPDGRAPSSSTTPVPTRPGVVCCSDRSLSRDWRRMLARRRTRPRRRAPPRCAAGGCISRSAPTG